MELVDRDKRRWRSVKQAGSGGGESQPRRGMKMFDEEEGRGR